MSFLQRFLPIAEGGSRAITFILMSDNDIANYQSLLPGPSQARIRLTGNSFWPLRTIMEIFWNNLQH
jgi:hypothetical protein